MPTYLIRKLEQFSALSAEDKQLLDRATGHKQRQLGPREDIVHEGDRPKHVNLLLESYACRYKTLEDGRRQIVAFLIPGDMCDMRMFLLKQKDHSVGTLSPAKVAEIPGEVFLDLSDRSPRLARALWWNSLVEEAIAREWVLNVGQRTAHERTAHLLCEFFIRMRAVGLVNDDSCELPMTQSELADALGLSTVHTNRVLQELRGDGIITLRGKALVVHDLAALQNIGLFNANYLHLDHEGRQFDAPPRVRPGHTGTPEHQGH
jgi:CRP-like cAMP-binding protein